MPRKFKLDLEAPAPDRGLPEAAREMDFDDFVNFAPERRKSVHLKSVLMNESNVNARISFRRKMGEKIPRCLRIQLDLSLQGVE